MTVAELLVQLQEMPNNAIVVVATDGVICGYVPLENVQVGRWKPTSGTHGGDGEFMEQGPGLRRAACLWPAQDAVEEQPAARPKRK